MAHSRNVVRVQRVTMFVCVIPVRILTSMEQCPIAKHVLMVIVIHLYYLAGHFIFVVAHPMKTVLAALHVAVCSVILEAQ